MYSKPTNSERDLAEELASGFYLRTGRLLKPEVFLAEFQRKFNPYHDPDDGRFTFGPGGGGSTSFAGGRGSSRTIYPVRNRIPDTTRGYPVRIDLPSSKPIVKPAAKPVFRFRHSAGLDLPDDVAERANALADAVSLRTGHRIHVSSGQRDARRQAVAMYDNYLQGNPPRYANRAAHAEVRRAFDRGRNGRAGRDAIIGAMTRRIE